MNKEDKQLLGTIFVMLFMFLAGITIAVVKMYPEGW